MAQVADSHWAFEPIQSPQVPDVIHADRTENPIDRFIMQRLEREQLTLSPEADRATLIRRATFDLIGLPPTPDEVRDFVLDERPDAYHRLIDRLLASPHHGEQGARPWLDLCHYADTDGYLTDQKVATGFLRQTLSNREGGADPQEFRALQVIDRTTMVGEIWMGLTVGCARCHDHKYDPLSQSEFFQLYAFLDNAVEVNINAPLVGEGERRAAALPEYEGQRRELLEPVSRDIAELQQRWEEKLLAARDNPGQDYRWDRQWEVLGLIWGGGLGEGQLEGWEIVQLDPAKRSPQQASRLLARRMVERGVRFVQLYHTTWDDHSDLNKNLKTNCDMTGRPPRSLRISPAAACSTRRWSCGAASSGGRR